VGELITYTFVVTNTGNVTLTNVTVTDPLAGLSAITCDAYTIPVGGFITCTATYAVTQADIDAGSVYNLATADSDESGPDDDDNTEPLPQNAAISLNKVTVDGISAGDGLNILIGESITWKYTVKNTGNVTLFSITVTDDQSVDIDCNGGMNTTSDHIIASMVPNATVVCTASGTATAGQYNNQGNVTALPPTSMPQTPITDDDTSSYFGADPQIAVAKVTVDGTYTGDGISILTGESIKWRYTVANVGNVALSSVSVTDSQSGVTPAYVSGDANSNSRLDLTETWIFEASGTAITGNYNNAGTASGTHTDSAGHSRTDTASDTSSYFGANPQIDIVKKTVGSDGTEGDNVFMLFNGAVTWKYYVTNTGNVALSSLIVTDSVVGVNPTYVSGDTNSNGKLDLTETWLFTATGTNTTPAGTWYNNIGTASGSYTDSAGHSRTDTDTDTSAYYSGTPGSVTNSQLCDFGPNFRLVFTPDSRYYTSAYQAYKLSDSNPGQFFYNVFYTNPGTTTTVSMDIPYPFVTQGAMPVHVYSGLTVSPTNGGTPSPDNLANCFVPSTTLRSYGSIITLSSYTDTNLDGKIGFGDVVRVSVPAEPGFQYINIHLDYGLEKTDGWVRQGSNANTDQTKYPGRANIMNLTAHTFKAYTNGTATPGTGTLISGSTDTVYNENTFKQVRGFGGLIYTWNGSIYVPLPGATVKVYKGTVSAANLKDTMTSDADGWYLSTYVHTGKAATYKLVYIEGATPRIITVTAGGSLKFGEGNFYIGGPTPTP
jgi:hypothetical protein